MDHMKLPQFLWIKDQLDIIDNGGNVLQRSTLNQEKKKETIAKSFLAKLITSVID